MGVSGHCVKLEVKLQDGACIATGPCSWALPCSSRATRGCKKTAQEMFLVSTVAIAPMVKRAAIPLVGATGVVRTLTPFVASMATTAVPTATNTVLTRAKTMAAAQISRRRRRIRWVR